MPSLCDIILYSKSKNVSCKALKALKLFASFGDEFRQLLVKTTIIGRLVQLCKTEVSDILHLSCALDVVTELVSGTDEHRKCILDQDLLSNFSLLSEHMDRQIRMKASKILSHIISSSQEHLTTVIEAGLLKHIVDDLLKGGSLAQNAVETLYHLTEGENFDSMRHFIQLDATLPFCVLMNCTDTAISKVSF